MLADLTGNLVVYFLKICSLYLCLFTYSLCAVCFSSLFWMCGICQLYVLYYACRLLKVNQLANVKMLCHHANMLTVIILTC